MVTSADGQQVLQWLSEDAIVIEHADASTTGLLILAQHMVQWVSCLMRPCCCCLVPHTGAGDDASNIGVMIELAHNLLATPAEQLPAAPVMFLFSGAEEPLCQVSHESQGYMVTLSLYHTSLSLWAGPLSPCL